MNFTNLLRQHTAALRALFRDPAAYDSWAPAWRERLAAQPAPAP